MNYTVRDIGHGCCICPDIAWVGNASARSNEETRANACLIAALQLIETDKDGDGFICREAMDLVRAAIAKTTGGTA